MLRDLVELGIGTGMSMFPQRADEVLHVAISAHGAETATGFMKGGGDPAKRPEMLNYRRGLFRL